MSNPIIKTITEQQWRTLRSETHNTIGTILSGVEALVDKKFDVTGTVVPETLVGAGLFSHAIEEYGKLLYLQSLVPINGMVQIECGGERRGGKFDNHKFKFDLAIQRLPTEHTTIKDGAFDPAVFDSASFDTGITTNWGMRLDIFNTDFDASGNVKKYPSVDVDTLRVAVTEFRKEWSKTTP